MKPPTALFIATLAIIAGVRAADPVTIVARGPAWTLQNKSLQATLDFAGGKLALTRFVNRKAGTDYLAGQPPMPLFSYRIVGQPVTANDGGWSLASTHDANITLYGKSWGKRLEITLTRKQPAAFAVRQVFELYDGGSMRCLSFIRNATDKPLIIEAADVLSLNLPDKPHQLHHVTGNLTWNTGTAGLHHGGRNAIARYDTGDGWFMVPENNWATCLEPGASKGDASQKLLVVDVWDNGPGVCVATNPKAVQLTLFPNEEAEFFSVNLGVFTGDAIDGRMAVAEHLRRRFKYIDPAPVLSTNDWQWGNGMGRRTEKDYREIVVPKAKAAGFDRVLIDDGWYEPDDSTTPKPPVANMAGITGFITDNGLKTGHWFSLQGRFCTRGWGEGRDAADPANIDFKLSQMEDELIAKYHCTWDQVDAGLLWKTDAQTAFSHPLDSVYRKILGMKRYMNTISHKYPDFIMQTTCEIDNPGGTAAHGAGAQNGGLIQLADNGTMGMYRRSEYADDVRDMFAAVGLFPLEGMLSTHGEDGIRPDSWQDSPLWFYQFLLARHTMIYSWPGDWSQESVGRMRVFNDWRKNPRINALLSEIMRPVYNGPDAVKNEGPWCWMVTDAAKSQALVFAINHRELNRNQSFDAKLRWLDDRKSYFIEEITQLPDASFNYNYRGEFTGARLHSQGLPIDLEAGEEHCAAFFVRENASPNPQVIYADTAIMKYDGNIRGTALQVSLEGTPNSNAQIIVAKPAKHGVESRTITLDANGKATAGFDATAITQGVTTPNKQTRETTDKGQHDPATAGAWHGKYGTLAAWIAGNRINPSNGFSLATSAPVYVWNKGDANAIPRMLEQPAATPGPKQAACWTTAEKFTLSVNAPATRRYRLSVYVMDYDDGKRGMDITVKSRDRSLLDRQSATVEDTAKGVYLTWDVTGPATIQAVKTAGINAAVSGVFVDEVAKPPVR
ncbi:MAG: hypothetical protein NTW21_08020 [Verrucomicrobia bacterium]|nr:hypothetical protein [Verrucomicrobiota bacterium]